MSAPPFARKRRQANYLRGIAEVALTDYDDALDSDEESGTPEERLVGYASVHVLASVFELPVDLVVEDVFSFRRIYDRRDAERRAS